MALSGGKQLLGTTLGRPGLDAIQPLDVLAALLIGRSTILDRADDIDVQAKAGRHRLARRTQAATSTWELSRLCGGVHAAIHDPKRPPLQAPPLQAPRGGGQPSAVLL